MLLSGMIMTKVLLSWVVCLILPTAQSEWLGDMERICGPVVDDLLYRDEDLAGKMEKCRLMRAAFACVEVETKKRGNGDWEFMVETQQVRNMSIRIANRCQKESLILCPRYKMNRRLQECYNGTGVPDMDWTCSTIRTYASQLNHTLSCMENAIRRCPNDDFISEDLSSLGNWTQIAFECLHPPPTTKLPNISEHNSGFGTTLRGDVILTQILTGLIVTVVN